VAGFHFPEVWTPLQCRDREKTFQAYGVFDRTGIVPSGECIRCDHASLPQPEYIRPRAGSMLPFTHQLFERVTPRAFPYISAPIIAKGGPGTGSSPFQEVVATPLHR
jgi:hypothetical protein